MKILEKNRKKKMSQSNFLWTATGFRGMESFNVLISASDEKEARATLVSSFTRLRENAREIKANEHTSERYEQEKKALSNAGVRDCVAFNEEWGGRFDILQEVDDRRIERDNLDARDSDGTRFIPLTLLEWARRVKIVRVSERVIVCGGVRFADF